jgi:hypothetical protein
MTRQEAREWFSNQVCDMAVDAYETDFGKTFSSDEATENTDQICGEPLDYLYKAKTLLGEYI